MRILFKGFNLDYLKLLNFLKCAHSFVHLNGLLGIFLMVEIIFLWINFCSVLVLKKAIKENVKLIKQSHWMSFKFQYRFQSILKLGVKNCQPPTFLVAPAFNPSIQNHCNNFCEIKFYDLKILLHSTVKIASKVKRFPQFTRFSDPCIIHEAVSLTIKQKSFS